MTLQLGCAEPSQHRRTRDTPDVSAFDQKAIEAAGPSLIFGVRIPHVLYVSPSGAASSLARIFRRAGVHWPDGRVFIGPTGGCSLARRAGVHWPDGRVFIGPTGGCSLDRGARRSPGDQRHARE
jgi:hypothetical protein